MQPQLGGTSMLSVGQETISRASLLDLLISIIVLKASVHPGQCSADLGFVPSTWWMLKSPFLQVQPCLV